MDLDGRPVERASVSAEGTAWAAASGADGAFRVGPLHAGRTRLSASVGVMRSEALEVATGATGVEIRLDPGLLIALRLAGAPGVPVDVTCDGARIDAGPGSRTFDRRERVLDRLEVRGLPRGSRWHVLVRIGKQECGLVEDVEAGAPERTATIATGKPIRGRIEGAPADLRGCNISVALGGAKVEEARCEADGTFASPPLPPGRYELSLRIHGATGWAGGSATGVEAGAEDVVLRVTPEGR